MKRNKRTPIFLVSGLLACSLAATAGIAQAREPESDSASAGSPIAFGDVDNYLGKPEYQKYLTQAIQWNKDNCPKWEFPASYPELQCAQVDVPLDWHHPEAGTIKLGISRLTRDADALSQRSKRLLFVNPGGPGAAGIWMPYHFPGLVPTETTHATVGIDPRGIGTSTRLHCDESDPHPADSYKADGDSRTYTKSGYLAEQAREDAITDRCAENPLGTLVNSEQAARDFTFVRALLGYDRADFLGMSYGSWLGATMTRMFPGQFDRVVLDSNLDWTESTLQGALDHQVQGFQAVLDQVMIPFWSRHDDRYGLGTSPAAVNQSIERIRRNAASGAYGPSVTPDYIDRAISRDTYSAIFFDDLGQWLGNKLKTSATPPASEPASAPLSDDTIQGFNPAVFRMVTCSDRPLAETPQERFSRVEAASQTLPLVGAKDMAAPCTKQAGTGGIPDYIHGRALPPVLVVQSEVDPATPYLGAVKAIAKTPNARFVSVDDFGGHSALGTNPCADAAIAGYLVNGVFPDKHIGCQAGPLVPSVEREVYEYFNPLTPDRTYPRAHLYGMRNLAPAQLDAAATNAWQAANPVSANSFGSRATRDDELRQESRRMLHELTRGSLPGAARR